MYVCRPGLSDISIVLQKMQMKYAIYHLSLNTRTLIYSEFEGDHGKLLLPYTVI